jgi:hypothetical protein
MAVALCVLRPRPVRTFSHYPSVPGRMNTLRTPLHKKKLQSKLRFKASLQLPGLQNQTCAFAPFPVPAQRRLGGRPYDLI